MSDPLTLADLDQLTGAEIHEALNAGRLDALIGKPAPYAPPTVGQLDMQDFDAMSRTQRHAAIRRGQFRDLLRGQTFTRNREDNPNA